MILEWCLVSACYRGCDLCGSHACNHHRITIILSENNHTSGFWHVPVYMKQRAFATGHFRGLYPTCAWVSTWTWINSDAFWNVPFAVKWQTLARLFSELLTQLHPRWVFVARLKIYVRSHKPIHETSLLAFNLRRYHEECIKEHARVRHWSVSRCCPESVNDGYTYYSGS